MATFIPPFIGTAFVCILETMIKYFGKRCAQGVGGEA